ncbi:hypothetical protein AVEN_271241-1 [Araneus ventricosus]|uniref:Uncharacterized protein n=1 Tax=Araneus ventricosus TaxID=182803 RepID=A0A4Y2G0B6_ARAVE|nr:hypothetical protein AVEN_271241-1 [Araneus ventricosus]
MQSNKQDYAERRFILEYSRKHDAQNSEIFCHVGGLLAYWLGISVFTFTDIMENVFRKVVKWKKIFKKKEEEIAPTSEIHQC